MKKQRPRCYSYRQWLQRLERVVVLLALLLKLLHLVLQIWSLF